MSAPWRATVALPEPWVRIGDEHPTELSESDNLAACIAPSRSIAPHTIPLGISVAQLEAVALALAAFDHDADRGFWLGDATGVGKGRTIAAVLHEQCSEPGAVGVWVTSSSVLFADARRDLVAVAGAEVAEARMSVGIWHVTTYRALQDVRRLAQLVGRLRGVGRRATVVFDEAHAAKNPTSGCSRVCGELQRALPEAAILYSTATAASSVDQIGYMERLGLWGPGTPFREHVDFAQTIKRRGNAAMELVSLDLKRRGKYTARSLRQVAETIESVTVPQSPEDVRVYDDCVAFWNRWCLASARRLSFFQLLITAQKIPGAVERARNLVARGFSVLITVQHTGGAAQSRGDRAMVAALRGATTEAARSDPECHAHLERLASTLPPEPVAALMEQLAPLGVVELSGRAGATLRDRVDLFQGDRVHVAVVTAASSQGVSLHAEAGLRPRAHLLVELPWSAEAMLQQCGRSSRSGQVVAPRYELLVSDVPAEARFTSSLVKRMAHLGALTRGDCAAAFTGARELGDHCEALWSVKVPALLSVLAARSVLNTAHELGLRPRDGEAADWNLAARTVLRDAFAAEPALRRTASRTGAMMAAVTGFALGAPALAEGGAPLCRALLFALRREPLLRFCGGLAAVGHPGDWRQHRQGDFAPVLQRQVMTVLCGAQRAECPLARLPSEVVAVIVDHLVASYSADYGIDAEAGPALRAICAAHTPVLYAPMNTRQLLNAAAAVPVSVQNSLERIARQVHTHRDGRQRPPQSGGVMALEDFVLGARAVDMRLGVVVTDGLEGTSHLSISAEHVACPDPLPTWLEDRRVVAYGTLESGSCYVVVKRHTVAGGYMLYMAGRARCTKSGQGMHLLATPQSVRHELPPGEAPPARWRARWGAERKEYFRVRRLEAAKIDVGLVVTGSRALELWEQSTQTVLRCAPPAVARPFTCLVLTTTARAP